MSYDLLEHPNPKKFFKKHKNNKKLLIRINKKYLEISENPFRPEFKELNSNKCTKCQRARVGDYRIIFYVKRQDKLIEIIDILHRSNDYRLY